MGEIVRTSGSEVAQVPREESAWDAALFVWGIWGLMLCADLALVARYAQNSPYQDEWTMIPALTGDQPVTPAWLWAQVADHRVPLPKLVLLGLYHLTGWDFRAGVLFNVLTLGALSAALIWTAKNLRGRVNYCDAFFPLVLLNWGQYLSFLWTWQVAFVLPTLFAGTVLIIIVRKGMQLTGGAVVLAGLCLVLLSVSGPSGLAYVPALGLWLGYSGVLRLRSSDPHGKRDGLLALGFVLAALLMIPWYFVGFEKPADIPPSPGPATALRTSLRFLSMSFGSSASALWPLAGVGIVALLLLSGGALLLVWRKHPGDRFRAAGLFLFTGAVICLALGLGSARAGVNPSAGLAHRYVSLAVPILCAVYFIWEICPAPRARRFMHMGLFSLMCVFATLNAVQARDYERFINSPREALERDLQAGVPPFILAEHHFPAIYPWSEQSLAEFLRMLHRAGVGQFRPLRDDPDYRNVPLPVAPTAVTGMKWVDGGGRACGSDATLTFSLEQPRFVHAIRLKCSYGDTTTAAPLFQVFWRNSQREGSPKGERHAQLPVRGRPFRPAEEAWKDRTVTVWVNDTIDEFRIHPDAQPGVFEILEIRLLVPAADSQRP